AIPEASCRKRSAPSAGITYSKRICCADVTSTSGSRSAGVSSVPHHVTGAGRAWATAGQTSTTRKTSSSRSFKGAQRTGSVAEVSAPREDHRRTGRADRLGDLVVAAGAARLRDRGDAGIESQLRGVREGEERVAREHRTLEIVAELARLLDRDADG